MLRYVKVVCHDTETCLCWITLYYHSSCLHLRSIIWGSDSKEWWLYASPTGVKSHKGQREIYLFPTLPSMCLNCLRSNWAVFLQLVRGWNMRSPTGKMSYKFLCLPVLTKFTFFHLGGEVSLYFSAAYTVKLNKNTLSQYVCTAKSKRIFNTSSYTLPTKIPPSHICSSVWSIANRFGVTIMCACGSTCSNSLKPVSASVLTGGLVRSRSHSASTDNMHLYPPFLPAVSGAECIRWQLPLPAFIRNVFVI